MFWNCQKCGFYNDSPGNCCNCGAPSVQIIDAVQNIDLLGGSDQTSLDQEPIVLDFLDHSHLTSLTSSPDNSHHQIPHSFDGSYNGNVRYQSDQSSSTSPNQIIIPKKNKQHFDEIDIGGDAYDIDALLAEPGSTNTVASSFSSNSSIPHSNTARINTNSTFNQSQSQLRQLSEEEIADQQRQGKEMRKRAKLEVQIPSPTEHHSVAFINSNYLSAETNLDYNISRMGCFDIFVYYIRENQILTFATLFLLLSFVLTIYLRTHSYEADSFNDRVSHFSPWAMGTLYIMYLFCCFPCGLFTIRSISFFSTTPHNIPFTSAYQFSEYVASHAPALTPDQIRTLQHKFSFSDQSALVYLSIPAQFRTRSSIKGIHHIPTVSESSNDGPNAILMPTSIPNSSDFGVNSRGVLNQGYKYPAMITTYKAIQFILFFCILEPLFGLFLSCGPVHHYRFSLKYK